VTADVVAKGIIAVSVLTGIVIVFRRSEAANGIIWRLCWSILVGTIGGGLIGGLTAGVLLGLLHQARLLRAR
jgi:hypothetical protein